MKYFIKLFFAASLFLILASCQTENSGSVDQKRIYTSYELTYDANTDITYARAQFRFGNALGTILKLSSNSSVKFNTNSLNYVEGLGYYEKQLGGQVSTGTFMFTDSLGKSYTNALDTITPIQLPASLTQFKRNNSSTVSWVGTAQKAKETVITTLHKTNTTNFYLSYGSGVGATEVLVPQNHINNFPSGTAAETFIERFVIDSLAQRPDVGGFSKIGFKGLKKAISIID